jgi:DedD protein
MDKVLKQRLVGAAILIALAVIFVPMLFDEGPEREGLRDTAIDLPPPPSDRREVRRMPLDPERARETPAPPVVEPVAPERSEREISLLDSDSAPADVPLTEPPEEPILLLETTPEPDLVPEPEPAAPAAPATGPVVATGEERGDAAAAFIVQVASFSSADTADRIADQLGRLGHDAAVDVIERGNSRLHRVRTGPYPNRVDAERARTQIATTVAGVEPAVMSAPAGLTAPRSPAAGLSVQVGSFTARVNADRLTEQLLAQGFDAFIHSDETGPRAIWRVRVGTMGSREEAARLQRDLLDRAGLEGLIVSHP